MQTLDEAFTVKIERNPVQILVKYGDIVDYVVKADENYPSSIRAVVSAEDTCLSAGGGVALALISKAGKYIILNELAKFACPIQQGDVAVTSGGKLPVHYIFHAAAIEVNDSGDYSATKCSVRLTMKTTLNKASALKVGALGVPLMGSGVAPLHARESFEAILEAIADWHMVATDNMAITVVVYREKDLSRDAIQQTIQSVKETRGLQIEVHRH